MASKVLDRAANRRVRFPIARPVRPYSSYCTCPKVVSPQTTCRFSYFFSSDFPHAGIFPLKTHHGFMFEIGTSKDDFFSSDSCARKSSRLKRGSFFFSPKRTRSQAVRLRPEDPLTQIVILKMRTSLYSNYIINGKLSHYNDNGVLSRLSCMSILSLTICGRNDSGFERNTDPPLARDARKRQDPRRKRTRRRGLHPDRTGKIAQN